MLCIDREYVELHEDEIIEAVKAGKIFIYPTDTIYGIGCNATDVEAVRKIRRLKNRPDEKSFSVIAPSKEWILKNCEVPATQIDRLDLLPGPYTLILRKKKENLLARDVNLNNDGTVGVRLPKHWFSEIISLASVPFVTTSVNISGDKHLESPDEITDTFKKSADYFIDEGEIKGVSSVKIKLLD